MPSFVTRFALVLAAVVLPACSKDPVFVPELARPEPVLMIPPPPLTDIPACEADPKCRVPYYGASRAQCSASNEKITGLQGYVKALHGGK